MEFVIDVVIRCHKFILYSIIFIAVIELVFRDIAMFYRIIRKNKSEKDIKIIGEFYSFVYFMINLIFLLGSIYIKGIPADFHFWQWLIIIFPLTIVFKKIINYILRVSN